MYSYEQNKRKKSYGTLRSTSALKLMFHDGTKIPSLDKKAKEGTLKDKAEMIELFDGMGFDVEAYDNPCSLKMHKILTKGNVT
jgi:hypothetical protein